MSNLTGNPKARFSRVVARAVVDKKMAQNQSCIFSKLKKECSDKGHTFKHVYLIFPD